MTQTNANPLDAYFRSLETEQKPASPLGDYFNSLDEPASPLTPTLNQEQILFAQQFSEATAGKDVEEIQRMHEDYAATGGGSTIGVPFDDRGAAANFSDSFKKGLSVAFPQFVNPEFAEEAFFTRPGKGFSGFVGGVASEVLPSALMLAVPATAPAILADYAARGAKANLDEGGNVATALGAAIFEAGSEYAGFFFFRKVTAAMARKIGRASAMGQKKKVTALFAAATGIDANTEGLEEVLTVVGTELTNAMGGMYGDGFGSWDPWDRAFTNIREQAGPAYAAGAMGALFLQPVAFGRAGVEGKFREGRDSITRIPNISLTGGQRTINTVLNEPITEGEFNTQMEALSYLLPEKLGRELGEQAVVTDEAGGDPTRFVKAADLTEDERVWLGNEIAGIFDSDETSDVELTQEMLRWLYDSGHGQVYEAYLDTKEEGQQGAIEQWRGLVSRLSEMPWINRHLAKEGFGERARTEGAVEPTPIPDIAAMSEEEAQSKLFFRGFSPGRVGGVATEEAGGLAERGFNIIGEATDEDGVPTGRRNFDTSAPRFYGAGGQIAVFHADQMEHPDSTWSKPKPGEKPIITVPAESLREGNVFEKIKSAVQPTPIPEDAVTVKSEAFNTRFARGDFGDVSREEALEASSRESDAERDAMNARADAAPVGTIVTREAKNIGKHQFRKAFPGSGSDKWVPHGETGSAEAVPFSATQPAPAGTYTFDSPTTTPIPEGGEVAQFEEKYGDEDKAFPSVRGEGDELLLEETGDSATICTSFACVIRKREGPDRVKIMGFDESNTDSEIAKKFFGHDFALVDDRYIVDPWAKFTLGEPKIAYDTKDPADAEAIARLYGPSSKWTHNTEAERAFDERDAGSPVEGERQATPSDPIPVTKAQSRELDAAFPSLAARLNIGPKTIDGMSESDLEETIEAIHGAHGAGGEAGIESPPARRRSMMKLAEKMEMELARVRGELPTQKPGDTVQYQGHEWRVDRPDGLNLRLSRKDANGTTVRAVVPAKSLTPPAQPIPEGESARAKTLPPRETLGENFAKPLKTFADKVYHETSVEDARVFLPDDQTVTDMGEVFVSNTPNLALGQGGKGVLLEFEAGDIQGRVNQSKPAWELAYDSGEAEFAVRFSNQQQWKDTVVSVMLAPGVQADSNLSRALSGWTQTSLPDGSVKYSRPTTEGESATEAEFELTELTEAETKNLREADTGLPTMADLIRMQINEARAEAGKGFFDEESARKSLYEKNRKRAINVVVGSVARDIDHFNNLGGRRELSVVGIQQPDDGIRLRDLPLSDVIQLRLGELTNAVGGPLMERTVFTPLEMAQDGMASMFLDLQDEAQAVYEASGITEEEIKGGSRWFSGRVGYLSAMGERTRGESTAHVITLDLPDAGEFSAHDAHLAMYYAGLKDPDTRALRVAGRKFSFKDTPVDEQLWEFTEADIIAIEEFFESSDRVTAGLKSIVDGFVSLINSDKVKVPLGDFLFRTQGRELGGDTYVPRFVEYDSHQIADIEQNSLGEQFFLKSSIQGSRFLKSRVENARQPETIPDIHAAFSQYIAAVSNIVFMTEAIQTSRAIMNHPDIKKRFANSRRGPKIFRRISAQLDQIEREASGVPADSVLVNNLANRLIRNFQVAALGWNFRIPFYQPWSLVASMAHPDIRDGSVATAFFSGKGLDSELDAEIREHMPAIAMRQRGSAYQRTTEAADIRDIQLGNIVTRQKGGVSTGAIRYMDNFAIRIIWAAAKESAGGDMKRAAEIAKDVIRTTQPMWDAIHQSGAGVEARNNPFVRATILFRSQRQANVALMIHSVRMAKQGRMSPERAIKTVIYTGFIQSLGIALTRRFTVPSAILALLTASDDELQEMLSDLIFNIGETAFGNFIGGAELAHAVRTAARHALPRMGLDQFAPSRGFSPEFVPWQSVFEMLMGAFGSILDATDPDEEQAKELVDGMLDIATTYGMVQGHPILVFPIRETRAILRELYDEKKKGNKSPI